MGMSRGEFGEWKKEHIPIEYEELLGQTDRALIVQVMSDKVFVGKSQIENLDDLLDCLEKGVEPAEGKFIQVPRWLAHNEGWEDDEPPE